MVFENLKICFQIWLSLFDKQILVNNDIAAWCRITAHKSIWLVDYCVTSYSPAEVLIFLNLSSQEEDIQTEIYKRGPVQGVCFITASMFQITFVKWIATESHFLFFKLHFGSPQTFSCIGLVFTDTRGQRLVRANWQSE